MGIAWLDDVDFKRLAVWSLTSPTSDLAMTPLFFNTMWGFGKPTQGRC
jgi:hypothetical protein